jgi:PAS domain S-box-containing protein
MEDVRYKILVVEDNELDQMAFMRMVEKEKLPYDCTPARSVSEAQKMLSTENFDVVITDYELGDGIAFDFLESAKDIPVILVTGAGDEELAVKAWRSGAYDYLIKDHERNYLRTLPVTIENVIRHKQTEEQLQLLSGAIRSTQGSVYITDMENKIIFVNKAFCETYRYKKEDVIGKDANILWMDNPQGAGTRSVFRVSSNSCGVGFYHRREDGSIFPVSLSRAIIKDANRNEVAVVGVAYDISERLLLEDELRTANLELKARNQLKSEFAVSVSERVNELLESLEHLVSRCKTQVRDENGGLEKRLVRAEEEISRVRCVLGEFLDISRIEAGKLRMESLEFNLCSVVSACLQSLCADAEHRSVKLQSRIPDCEMVVRADYNRIKQVLTELIGHAIESATAGGCVNVLVKDSAERIAVEVTDNGPSIDREEIYNVFNRYEQIRRQVRGDEQAPAASWRSQERGQGSTNLGLAIVKDLVEMQGGSVVVEKKEGGGNSFCFTLPRAEVGAAV